MKVLVESINQIVKYGLISNISEVGKKQNLEKNLISIYKLFFELEYKFDEAEYLEFDSKNFLNIAENIKSNFPEFGFYNVILNPLNIQNSETEIGLGDATDDLNDIIIDLLQVKWRLENNSYDDGIWFFKFIFTNHTKSHILGLLNYLNDNYEISSTNS